MGKIFLNKFSAHFVEMSYNYQGNFFKLEKNLGKIRNFKDVLENLRCNFWKFLKKFRENREKIAENLKKIKTQGNTWKKIEYLKMFKKIGKDSRRNEKNLIE